jgi:hypothetical protein
MPTFDEATLTSTSIGDAQLDGVVFVEVKATAINGFRLYCDTGAEKKSGDNKQSHGCSLIAYTSGWRESAEKEDRPEEG